MYDDIGVAILLVVVVYGLIAVAAHAIADLSPITSGSRSLRKQMVLHLRDAAFFPFLMGSIYIIDSVLRLEISLFIYTAYGVLCASGMYLSIRSYRRLRAQARDFTRVLQR